MPFDKKIIKFFLCGTAMGAADIVPGVSGGTIAYLCGIYPLLIQSITSFDAALLRNIFSRRWKDALRQIPLGFLIPLLSGILISLLSLSRIVSYLLLTSPQVVWGFFFGLLISSVFLMMRVQRLTFNSLFILVLGAAMAFCLTHMPFLQLEHDLPQIFISGSIALCAMILPGISGSFMLVLLGQYAFILQAVVLWNFSVLAVFILGGITGLALFSRALSFGLKKFPLAMHALMLGIMAGSLPVLWPWQTAGGLALADGSASLSAFFACGAGVILPLCLSAIAARRNKKESIHE